MNLRASNGACWGHRAARVRAWVLGLGIGLNLVLGISVGVAAETASKPTSAILVDKKRNQLHVTEYTDGTYKILKTYHATLGQVLGEKRDEGDLKTPEGIYTFTSLLRPPAIKPKFGAMAFYIDFPNAFDRIADNTGYDIMLHATNEPERLKNNFDSQGCIVVKNEEIEEIRPSIRLALTPVLVFGELTPEYMSPGKDAALRAFFENWIKAWETKNLDGYVGSYHSDFTAQGMDRDAWRKFKGNLNRAYQTISIGPESVRFYRHPKYSLVTFTQNYRSTRVGGGPGHQSRGTKMLYIAEEAGQPRIIAETFTNAMW